MRTITFLLLFVFLSGPSLGWQLNLEAKGGSKACLFDEFPSDHKIEISATLIEHIDSNGFVFLLLVENDHKTLIASSHYTLNSKQIHLEFVNRQSQTLHICIDNYLDKSIAVALEITATEINSKLNEKQIGDGWNYRDILSKACDAILYPGRWIGEILEQNMPAVDSPESSKRWILSLGLITFFLVSAAAGYILCVRQSKASKLKLF